MITQPANRTKKSYSLGMAK